MSYALRDRFANYLSPHHSNPDSPPVDADFLSLASPQKFYRWETEYNNHYIYPVLKPEAANEVFDQTTSSTVEQTSQNHYESYQPEPVFSSPQPTPLHSEPRNTRAPLSHQSPVPTAHVSDHTPQKYKVNIYDSTVSTGQIHEKQTTASAIRMKRTLTDREERQKKEAQEKNIQESLWRKNSRSNPSSPVRKKVSFSPQVLPTRQPGRFFTNSVNTPAPRPSYQNSPVVVKHTPQPTPSTPTYDELEYTQRNAQVPSYHHSQPQQHQYVQSPHQHQPQYSQVPASRDGGSQPTSSVLPRRLDAETLTRVLATSAEGRITQNFTPKPSPLNNPKIYKYVPASFMAVIPPAGKVEPRSPPFLFDEYD